MSYPPHNFSRLSRTIQGMSWNDKIGGYPTVEHILESIYTIRMRLNLEQYEGLVFASDFALGIWEFLNFNTF